MKSAKYSALATGPSNEIPRTRLAMNDALLWVRAVPVWPEELSTVCALKWSRCSSLRVNLALRYVEHLQVRF